MKKFIPDMNDRELDDLFRKAAAEYSPAGREEVWKKLEEKLNTRGPRRRKPLWWILLIVLFLGIAGFLLWPHGEKNLVNHKNLHDISINQQTTNNKPSNKQATVKEQNLPKKKKTIRSSEELSSQQSITLPRSIPSPIGTEKDVMESTDQSKYDLSALPALKKLSIQTVNGFQNELKTRQPLKDKIDFDSSHSFLQKENEKEITENSPEEKTPESKMRHWNFGMTAGPDWSSASGRGWKTGAGGGLKLTYKLNKKWAFSTGVLFDKKLYDAHPEDYNPRDDSWRNYDVQNIDAQCTIWDVPLNVEYTLWNNKGHAVFLSTGLSSFWMHEEEYTYYYKTSSGNWNEWSKELYDQNHHLFSILNFSAGYERSWKHFSLQAEPYLKIPLNGIGYGRVKLYSTGIHFTLQYGLK